MAKPVAVRDDTYIVVGAGVFGTSVALHLIQKYPSANVTLIDRTPFPSQVGASWDWNKVVRADYANLLYMELDLEAMELWRSDPLYQPFYHESGLVWVDNKGFPQDIIDNYKKLNSTAKYRLIKAEEANGLWDGIHADGNDEGAGDMLFNESNGWAEASAALTKTIERAVEAGVQYVVGDVEAVVFDDEGVSTGVRITKGDVLSASHIILATGAMTAKLIANGAPKRPEMQIAERLVAAAVCTGMAILTDAEAKYFRKGPFFVHALLHTIGGSIPPSSESRLKFYRDVSFTNTVHHAASGQDISMPPSQDDYAQWDVSPRMRE